MKIDILTLFPNMFDSFFKESIIKRAIENNKVEINVIDFREYSKDPHKKVDDTPYGGGAGMVLTCQPIFDCVESIRTKDSKVILLTPSGKLFKQQMAYDLSKESHLIIICGHYEGFDERIKSICDIELSIGDYVLTGGEIPAMAISDSVIRLLDNAIKEESYKDDSYFNGLLEYPQYTRPVEYNGKTVPEVLLNGNHKLINEYRLKESLRKTYLRRPDLLENRVLTKEEERLLNEIKKEEM